MARKRLHHLLVSEVSSLSQPCVWFKVQTGLAIHALCAMLELHFIVIVLNALPIGTRNIFHAALKFLKVALSYCTSKTKYLIYLQVRNFGKKL